MNHVDTLVTDYLQRLEHAAAGLPPDRRDELLDGITEHITAAGAQDEVAVRTLLDRLGEPEDIVAAAHEDLPGASSPWGPPVPRGTGHELSAVLLLTLGSFVPVVGWLAGVALLWTSALWRVREKVLGTLVVPLGPGGVLLAGALLPLGTRTEVCSSSGTLDGGPGSGPGAPPPFEGPPPPPGQGSVELQGVTCTTEGLDGWASGLLLGVLLLAPVVVAVLLMRTARRRAAEQPVAAPAYGPPQTASWGGLEVAGVLVLGLGGLLVPVVGPLVGLALVLSSRRWTRADKAVAATLSVLPVLLPLVRMVLPGVVPIGLGGGELLLLGVLVIGPALAAAYLAVVLQRRR